MYNNFILFCTSCNNILYSFVVFGMGAGGTLQLIARGVLAELLSSVVFV